ncbi:MAG: ribosome biogenesis GTP-binding protein YihA/YsxC [Rikenellaceae bacterium]
MNIKSAIFKCSSEKISQLPTEFKEIAFIGRSNVGKSSLINMLTDKPGLAKVSSTPGKTKLVNHFTINDEWYLVDLPGYGYARTSKTSREKFAKLITNYLTKSDNLHYLFVLLDIRHEPQKIDLEFITMLGEEGIPFGLIFTKADKLSPNQGQSSVAKYKKVLLKDWEELPPIFISSSEKKTGKEEILDYCEQILTF